MKRPYTVEEFRETAAEIREKIPEIAITTDVIVGFPGETRESFEQTLKVVEEIAFSKVHVFPFSAREGTPAAEMKNKVNGNIIKDYSRELRELNQELMLSYQEQFIGRTKDVLIEEERDHNTGLLTGYTDNYLKVLAVGNDSAMNKLKKIKLTQSEDHAHVRGKIIK